ncbi:MAG: threonine synthase [Cyanobacteria bacterium]|nr:threonine synthase [Cyanobacteriota bacterium]
MSTQSTGGILSHYADFYPPELQKQGYPLISLHEGNTPLIPACHLAEWIEKNTPTRGLRIFLKYEGLNPTGSFKDRGMTYAVSQAKADGAVSIICASTGNTSAAAAAYGTRAGLKTYIVLPSGKVALGKLSQAILYGAEIMEIEGNFDQALTLVRQLGETGKVTVVNSINPYRIQGQKSAAFEVCDALGNGKQAEAPDYLFIPVGNAGNITAYWLGFCEYYAAGKITQKPKMMGYEAEGSAAIVQNRVIDNPETLATAIRIGNPASWSGAVSARDESGGLIGSVTDAEIIHAYQLLAGKEGIFCEPASAASFAGLIQAAQRGEIANNQSAVCVLTGNGLKDPDNAIAHGAAKRHTLAADDGIDRVLDIIEKNKSRPV